jgi:N-acyl amino acid synthase of PEP-CTERM/exosortase system
MTLPAAERIAWSHISDVLEAAETPKPIVRTLLDEFNERFEMQLADTPDRVRLAQVVRYQVYCVENAYEAPKASDHLETDEFDSHAVHTLLSSRANAYVLGTVRLILPLADRLHDSFPLQRVMDASSLNVFNTLPLRMMGEVSRFSISREFRRTAEEGDTSGHLATASNSGPLMRLGLVQGLIRMCIDHGITHWCAAMEITLLRMLAAMGIRFQAVGPVVEHHGPRQPCYCVIPDMLDVMRRERPAFWSVLTNGGALAY